MSRSVGPPSAQCVLWWACTNFWCRQPGNWQPRPDARVGRRSQAGIKPRSSTDPQHFGVVVDGTFDDRITGQSAGGLIGDDRTTLDLGHPGRLRNSRSMLRDRREPRFELEPNRSHHRWWHRVRLDPSAIRCGYGSNNPDSGLGGIRSALRSDRRFHQRHFHPGQISVQMASDPVQGVLDRQPPHPATNRPHPQRWEGWLAGRHDPKPHSTNPNTRKSPLPRSPQ